jgi:hypothetical protein
MTADRTKLKAARDDKGKRCAHLNSGHRGLDSGADGVNSVEHVIRVGM